MHALLSTFIPSYGNAKIIEIGVTVKYRLHVLCTMDRVWFFYSALY